MSDINTKANYTVEEWLAIFKESEPVRCGWNDWESPMVPFELVVSEVLGMTNYSDYPDYYWGFVFFETLRLVSRKCDHEDVELKVVKLDEFLPEPFTMLYLAMVNMNPFKDSLNWGTSIRGAWFDYEDFLKYTKELKLNHCGLQFNEEQIMPCINTKEDLRVFFSALLKYYDNYLVELGPDKVARMKDMVYNKSFNEMDSEPFLTQAYIDQYGEEDED